MPQANDIVITVFLSCYFDSIWRCSSLRLAWWACGSLSAIDFIRVWHAIDCSLFNEVFSAWVQQKSVMIDKVWRLAQLLWAKANYDGQYSWCKQRQLMIVLSKLWRWDGLGQSLVPENKTIRDLFACKSGSYVTAKYTIIEKRNVLSYWSLHKKQPIHFNLISLCCPLNWFRIMFTC